MLSHFEKLFVKNVQEQNEIEILTGSHLAKDEMTFVYNRIHVLKEMSSFSCIYISFGRTTFRDPH
jgi:uncharacterized circularly permuted ATP-grasp superfamily protein